MFRNLYILFFLVILFSIQIVFSINAQALTYYVDSVDGNDANNGTEIGTPIQSINELMGLIALTPLDPGDQILFKRGGVWRDLESMRINQSGTSESPIVISAYGEGARPIIKGSAILNDGVTHSWTAANSNFPGVFYIDNATAASLDQPEELFINDQRAMPAAGASRYDAVRILGFNDDHAWKWDSTINRDYYNSNFERGHGNWVNRDRDWWYTDEGAENGLIQSATEIAGGAIEGHWSYFLQAGEKQLTKKKFNKSNVVFTFDHKIVSTTATVGQKTGIFQLQDSDNWGASDKMWVVIIQNGDGTHDIDFGFTGISGGHSLSLDDAIPHSYKVVVDTDNNGLALYADGTIVGTTLTDSRFQHPVNMFQIGNIGQQAAVYKTAVDNIRIYPIGGDVEQEIGFNTVILRDQTGDPDTSGVTVEGSYIDKPINLLGNDWITISNLEFNMSTLQSVFAVASGNDMEGILIDNVIAKNAARSGFFVGGESFDAYATNITIRNSTGEWNGGNGFAFPPFVHDATVSNNVARHNAQDVQDDTAGIRTTPDAGSQAELRANYNIWVTNNIMYGNGFDELGNVVCHAFLGGYGLWIDTISNGTWAGVPVGEGGSWVTGNAAYNNVAAGVYIEASSESRINNNVTFGNKYGYRFDTARGSENAQGFKTYVDSNIIEYNISIDDEHALYPRGVTLGEVDLAIFDNIFRYNIIVDSTVNALWLRDGAANEPGRGSGNVYTGNYYGTPYTGYLVTGGDSDVFNEYDTVAEFNAGEANVDLNPETDMAVLDQRDDEILANNVLQTVTALRLLTTYEPAFDGAYVSGGETPIVTAPIKTSRQVRLSQVQNIVDSILGFGWSINNSNGEVWTELVQVPPTADSADLFISSATLNAGDMGAVNWKAYAQPLIPGATIAEITQTAQPRDEYGRYRLEVPAGGKIQIMSAGVDSVTREFNLHFNSLFPIKRESTFGNTWR